MMRKVAMVLFASFLSGLAPSRLIAQTWEWGRSPFPRDGACFFKDPDFRGDYFCAPAGESLSAVPKDMNDKISSIRIFGRADVTVFKDVRFDGGSRHFRDSIGNLKDDGWNDRVSSFCVGGSSDSGGGAGRTGCRPYRSARLPGRTTLARARSKQGLRLDRSRIIDDGWTEQQVREALRSSPDGPRADDHDTCEGAGDRPSCLPGCAQARARRRQPGVRQPRPARSLDTGRRRTGTAQEPRIPQAMTGS